MFSSVSARERFTVLCHGYYTERVRQEAAEQAGVPLPHSHRAEIHNQIMEIVQKLFLRSQDRMPKRKEVGNMIMDHFRGADGPE